MMERRSSSPTNGAADSVHAVVRTIPNKWGADAIFNLKDNKLSFASYYKLPAAQGDSENCVAHNGSLIPIPGRDIKVQAWYQGGISVMDFTDANNVRGNRELRSRSDRSEHAHPRRISGPAYWYNGHIYSSEIARGLDVFELTPTENLTQNEIDAAKTVWVGELNVQNQQRIVWPNKLVVAKAYLDQLERSKGLAADRIASVRSAIDKAETSKKKKDLKELKSPFGIAADRCKRFVGFMASPGFGGCAEETRHCEILVNAVLRRRRDRMNLFAFIFSDENMADLSSLSVLFDVKEVFFTAFGHDVSYVEIHRNRCSD
jgi:hypothetical protein